MGHHLLLSPFASNSTLSLTRASLCLQNPRPKLQNSDPKVKPILLPSLLSLALSASLISFPLPSLAIPSLSSQSSLLSPTTPFSQSKNLETGLENGYGIGFAIFSSQCTDLMEKDYKMGFALGSFLLKGIFLFPF